MALVLTATAHGWVAFLPARDRPTMFPISTSILGQACRIFMAIAYEDDPATIPPLKLPYRDIQGDQPVTDYLTPAPQALGICQKLGSQTFTFRLGSSRYANLKLKVQCVGREGEVRCILSVDTHDAFSPEHVQPPAGHPDAAAWIELQAANRTLKEKIEAAWEAAGLSTFNGMLRDGLREPSTPRPVPLATATG